MMEHDAIRALLERSGKNPDLADALARIDIVSQTWRRQMRQRELGQRAITALKLDLELTQLDVLFAIDMDHGDPSRPEDETMVATVAERLCIDPSRASRVVAEMVASGYARRAVSQRDARRTVLQLTEAGEAVVAAVRGYKWLLLGEFFANWSRSDLDTFVPLLERYTEWLNQSQASEARFGNEISELADGIARARAMEPSGSKSG